MEADERQDLPRKSGKNWDYGRTPLGPSILRKIKITDKQKQNDMEIYEIIVHFKVRKMDGTLERWDLSQKELYEDEEEAKAAARRLRNLFRSLGQQLVSCFDGPGARVWTSDPEAFKRIYKAEPLGRELEIYEL